MAERSPTLTTALLLVAVYLVEEVLRLLGSGPGVFALSTPVGQRPWTVVTSVYAHAGPGHLVANLVGLLVVGFGLLGGSAAVATGMVDEALFGYRPDPRDGFAHRAFHFEYEPRDGDRILGRALHFLLFSPDRLRDSCVGTPWSVVDVEHHHEVYYEARLAK